MSIRCKRKENDRLEMDATHSIELLQDICNEKIRSLERTKSYQAQLLLDQTPCFEKGTSLSNYHIDINFI